MTSLGTLNIEDAKSPTMALIALAETGDKDGK